MIAAKMKTGLIRTRRRKPAAGIGAPGQTRSISAIWRRLSGFSRRGRVL